MPPIPTAGACAALSAGAECLRRLVRAGSKGRRFREGCFPRRHYEGGFTLFVRQGAVVALSFPEFVRFHKGVAAGYDFTGGLMHVSCAI